MRLTAAVATLVIAAAWHGHGASVAHAADLSPHALRGHARQIQEGDASTAYASAMAVEDGLSRLLVSRWARLSKERRTALIESILPAALARIGAGVGADLGEMLGALVHRAVMALGPKAAIPSASLGRVLRPKAQGEAVRGGHVVGVLNALRILGPRAKGAVADIAPCLTSPNDAIVRAAAGTLSSLGPTGAAFLAARLGHERTVVRRAAVAALGRVRPFPVGRLATLAGTTKDEDPYVALAAIDALSVLGGDGTDLAPALDQIKALTTHSSLLVRASALSALRTMGKRAVPALKEIRLALWDESPRVSQAASNTLARMGTSASPALRALDLLAAQDNADATSRRVAKRAAASIRSVAAAAAKKSTGR